jgi:RNA polymerase sigma factor (sigma-70 family)
MRIGRIGVLRQLRALFEGGTATGLSDKELLDRYTAERAETAEAAAAAETAFAALMDRHGAMVWGVCHRVLGNADEAEDAFQATFLILVRKAGSVRFDESLGRWLYGVAHRVALRARSDAGHRRSALAGVPQPSSDDPAKGAELRELRTVVGEEVDGLPMKYRCPVELCHLQGLTYDQAARKLNWPVATVKNRLTKGRLRLRARLARRGLAPGTIAVGLTTGLTDEARAAIPQALVQSTARAATAPGTGAFPAVVTDLTNRVLKMMLWQKLRLVPLGVLLAVGLTAQALWQQTANGWGRTEQPRQTAARPSQEQKKNEMRDPRWTRILQSGATIEVIGVSSVPSGPHTWWRPDGSPLLTAPRDPGEPEIKRRAALQRLIVVRLTQIPLGADQEWSIVEAFGTHQMPTKRNGTRVTGLSDSLVALPIDARSCTVRFKVAAGPWNAIHTTDNDGAAGGTQIGASYILGDAIATASGTSRSLTHNFRGQCVRIVAVDEARKETVGVIRSTVDVTDFRQVVFEFDQPLAQIKEFRLEIRPFEQIEIPHIAVEPE